ncbi:hypothetical protein GGF46_004591 [Coemansia sp. RSA 552]|nr:hypothetical protein GGF46_004591 [Coemansia sp. RSA 552]
MGDLQVGVELDTSKWEYSGEGNQKVVFAYTGADPELRGWLLLLNKRDVQKDGGAKLTEPAEVGEATRGGQEGIAFSANVVGSLLGSGYVLPHKLVSAAPETLAAFEQQLGSEDSRPAHRRHREIDPRQQVAVLTHNMLPHRAPGSTVERSSVTVELKPKWGFLPTSAAISPGNEVKRRACRYCMHQVLKHGGQPVSQFCPLDLFSESQHRMLYALTCLEKSPQNNLRVFVDGCQQTDFALVPEWAGFKDLLARILLEDGLLLRLKRLQKSLDRFDIEGVYPMYQRAVAAGELNPDKEPGIDDWMAAVRAFQQGCNEPSDKQAVLWFLLSTVLKDISVMITVDQWPPPARAEDVLPTHRIAVIDTEPKKLAKMPRYFEQSQTIVSKYLEARPDQKTQHSCLE